MPTTGVIVSVLTSKREVDTLTPTLQSLAKGGFEKPFVYEDKQLRSPLSGLVGMRTTLLSQYGNKRPVLTFQDDITVCLDIARYTNEVLVPLVKGRIGLISLYLCEFTRKRLFAGNRDHLLASIETKHFCGALAWLWNPAAMTEMLSAKDFNRDSDMGDDVVVPAWLVKHGWWYLHHQPSLVDHDDQGHSTYRKQNPSMYRRSDTFIGEKDSIYNHVSDIKQVSFSNALNQGDSNV